MDISNFVKEYFEKLRFNKGSHLGLGDIKLTIDQQEEIIGIIESYERLMRARIGLLEEILSSKKPEDGGSNE